MVVVPTSHHVSLSYGYTPVDYEGWGLTLLALVGLFFLIRRPVAPVVAVRRPALGPAGLGRRERRWPGGHDPLGAWPGAARPLATLAGRATGRRTAPSARRRRG